MPPKPIRCCHESSVAQNRAYGRANSRFHFRWSRLNNHDTCRDPCGFERKGSTFDSATRQRPQNLSQPPHRAFAHKRLSDYQHGQSRAVGPSGRPLGRRSRARSEAGSASSTSYGVMAGCRSNTYIGHVCNGSESHRACRRQLNGQVDVFTLRLRYRTFGVSARH